MFCRYSKLIKNKNGFAVSTNMAYDDINLKPTAGRVDGGESEKHDRILKAGTSINESNI